MRQHALPSPASLHKNICGPFLRAELLSHEFTLRAGYRGNHCALSINADPEIFGFHDLMSQGARFDHLEKARPVNYFSIRVNDDPIICDQSSNTFEIISDDCRREFFFDFQKFFFRFAALHSRKVKLDAAVAVA
jgi:hypothetical protein